MSIESGDQKAPSQQSKKDDQEFWFFFFTVFFVFFSIVLGWILSEVNGNLPTSISIFDALLIALASMRLTRLFVYDSIMGFVRNWFLVKKERRNESGGVYYVRVESEYGPKKTLRHLVKCPWCAGLWFSLLLVFFYFLTPITWIGILVLAIASVSTFIQILTNWLGSAATARRLENEGWRDEKK